MLGVRTGYQQKSVNFSFYFSLLDYNINYQVKNDINIMGDDLYICIASCNSTNSSGALIGNDSYDLECITQCSQRQMTLYHNTAEK
jgi:hypothetical protein